MSTCSFTIATGASSVILASVSEAGVSTAPSAVAAHGYTSVAIASYAGGVGVNGLRLYGFYAVASASIKVYVNFSATQSYTVELADFIHTVTTSTFYSGSGSNHGSSTAPACTLTMLWASDTAVFMTNIAAAETTFSQSGSTGTFIIEKDTTSNIDQDGAYALPAASGSYTGTATWGTTGLWGDVCVDLLGTPDAPTGVTEVSGSPTTTTAIGITWTNPSGTLTQNVVLEASYSTGSCGSYSSSGNIAVATSYTWSGLTIGNAYCFEVEAVNTVGTSSASTALSNAPTITAAPTALATGAITTTTVVLTWTAPTTSPASGVITSYTVQSAAWTSSCGTFGTPETVANGGSYTGLTAGNAYCFEVAAVDAGGTSVYSTAATNVVTIPNAPATPTQSTTTTTTMVLTWSPVNGATSYSVFQATYSGSCGSYNGGTIGSEPFTATGLSLNTAYCFYALATNTNGWDSANSGILSDVFTIPLPTSLTVSPQPGTTSQFNLGWVLSAGPGTLVNQTLWQSTGSSCLSSGATWTNIADPTATAHVVTGLTAGTTYSYEIGEWNSYGIGWSTCVTATTFTVPSAPTGLSETSETAYSVTLSWSNPGGTLFNDTMLEGTSCGTWLTQTSTNGVATSGTVNGLQPYTTYCFAVEAWSGGGASAASSPLSVTTLGGVPGAPTGLALTQARATTMSFTWTNPVALIGSEVNATFYWGTSCGAISGGSKGTWTSDANLGSALTAYQVTGLSSLTSYCFSVALWTQAGQGAQSVTVTASTPNPVLSAPTSLTYISASHNAVTLSWSQTATYPALNDTVAYTTVAACASGLTLVSTVGPTTAATINGLTTATTYYWEVSVWDNGGPSGYSSCITGATQGASPPMPYDVTAQLVGSTSVEITWVNPSGYSLIDDFVNVSNANGACGSWSQTVNLGQVTTSYLITGLTAGKTYCIQVNAVDDGGPPATIVITIPTASVSTSEGSNFDIMTFADTLRDVARTALPFVFGFVGAVTALRAKGWRWTYGS